MLKTLGATRMRIVRTFSVEFSVLGLLAGAVGVVFANLLTRVLLHKLDVALSYRMGRDAGCAGRDGGAGHGHRLDRELPNSWIAAAGSVARGVNRAGNRQSANGRSADRVDPAASRVGFVGRIGARFDRRREFPL